jgi:predicted transposase YbfD/YdcC
LVLGQRQVDDKSNEITAIPELLSMLSLKNSIVTIDAMGCQRAIAEKILTQGADYILALKGNQKTMHQAVAAYCATHCFQLGATQKPDVDFFDDRHGRVVRRRIFACPEACELAPLQEWPGLGQVLAVETIRRVNGTSTTQADIRYFLSSCPDSVEKQVQGIRRHWEIENRVHWVLDMSFREDDCRIREKTSARCFAVLRKIALNLVRQDKHSRVSLKARRKQSAWSNEYMQQILFGKFHA